MGSAKDLVLKNPCLLILFHCWVTLRGKMPQFPLWEASGMKMNRKKFGSNKKLQF